MPDGQNDGAKDPEGARDKLIRRKQESAASIPDRVPLHSHECRLRPMIERDYG